MRQKLLSAFLFASFAPLLFTGVQQVSATASIGISPAYPRKDNERTANIFVSTIKPGESVDDGVRVFNYSKERKTVQLRAVDSIQAIDGSFACRQDSEARKEVGSWTKLEALKVTLEPGASKVIDFTITLPKDVLPGEHGGCITAQDDDSFAAKSGSGIQLGFRSAIRMAITVPGKIVKELSLQNVEVNRTETGDYTVSPIAKNTGNVSLDLKTRAQIVDVFGRESPVQTADYPIMRDTTTGWPFKFERRYWGGLYKARTSISFNADTSAGLGERVNDTKKIRKDTGYFFMIGAPEAIAIEIGVPLLLIALLIWKLRRRKQKKTLRLSWEQHTVVQGESIMSLAAERKTTWKKIARVNKLKEPYILQVGQIVLLPQAQKNDDWIVVGESAQTVPEAVAVVRAVEIPDRAIEPEKSSKKKTTQQIIDPIVQTEWVSPRESTMYGSDDDNFVDWREGADDEEIEKIERIDDVLLAARYKNVWDEDELKSEKRSNGRSLSTRKKRKINTNVKTKSVNNNPKKAK